MAPINHIDVSTDFCAAIGELTLNFAAAEIALEFIVAMIFHEIGVPEFPEIPRSLDNKLDYLRRGFDSDRLAPLRAKANRVIGAVHNLKEDRHRTIHDALAGIDADGTIQRLSIRHKPKMHFGSVKPLTTKQVKATATKAFTLADSTFALYVVTHNLLFPQDPIDHT